MYMLFGIIDGVHTVTGRYKDIIVLARQLEVLAIEFKISNGSSYVDQASCGYSGFNYWLNPKTSFNTPSTVA